MDIQLEKKKGFQKKHIPYVAGGAFFLILVGWIVFGDHASTLKVDARLDRESYFPDLSVPALLALSCSV